MAFYFPLMRHFAFVALTALLPLGLRAQTAALPTAPARLQTVADSAYKAKNYVLGAVAFARLAESGRFNAARASARYNAACCRALAGQQAEALGELTAAVRAGYANADNLRADSDLTSLRALPALEKLLAQAEAQRLPAPTDPEKAQLVTSDIDLFWRAYDLAQREPARAAEIYDREYFEKGSVGLQDYYVLKIQRTSSFVKNQLAKPNFYRAIRPNTLRVAGQTAQIRAGFRKLKALYPAAVFPNVYFVMGRWSSGGTASEHGMLLGTDQSCATADTPLGELSLWERGNIGKLVNVPAVVAHEQIHYLQKAGGPPTLLHGAIDEGMADFLAELTAGANPNARLRAYGLPHEKEIWADFQKEMAGEKWDNWIANSDQETAAKPADLGYFVGYRICESYYQEVADKKQAVHDMLNISDFPTFLAKSRYAEKLAAR